MDERIKNIKVKLNTHECRLAAITGLERRLESIFGGYHRDVVGNDSNYKGKSWDYEIEGAGAELAVCKNRKLYCPFGINTFKNADIGKILQVRHTERENGRLIVRPNDNPNHTYILVIGKMPNFKMIGWIKGKDAMVDEYKDNPNRGKPCWMVPQKDLVGFKGIRGIV